MVPRYQDDGVKQQLVGSEEEKKESTLVVDYTQGHVSQTMLLDRTMSRWLGGWSWWSQNKNVLMIIGNISTIGKVHLEGRYTCLRALSVEKGARFSKALYCGTIISTGYSCPVIVVWLRLRRHRWCWIEMMSMGWDRDRAKNLASRKQTIVEQSGE